MHALRYVRSAFVAGVIACAAVTITAAPASAHGLGGLTPTNYKSRFTGVTPAAPGIRVRVTDLGNRMALTNTTGHDVTVLGYDGEPYLRVGPHGVFENTRSPATYLNRTTTITSAPPKSADPKAPPEWSEVSSGRTARWHDHRVHFMGTSDPPIVTNDRGRAHVIDHWTVPIRDGNRTVDAAGEIIWIPPPSPWPYVATALVVAAAVVLASRTRAWRWVLVVSLGALVASEVVHVVAAWGASTSSGVTKLVESVYSIGGIALGVLALVWARRRGVDASIPIILVAAIVLLVSGGLSDVTSLGHSQLPTTMPWWLSRVLVTIVLGVGTGLVAAAGWRLGSPRPRTRRPVTRPAVAERARVTS